MARADKQARESKPAEGSRGSGKAASEKSKQRGGKKREDGTAKGKKERKAVGKSESEAEQGSTTHPRTRSRTAQASTPPKNDTRKRPRDAGDMEPAAKKSAPALAPASADFPRGGVPVLTPSERRALTALAAADVRAEAAGALEASDAAIPRTRKTRDAWVHAAERPSAPPAPLDFRSLSVGMTLLGVVKRIARDAVVVALPSRLTGYVARSEISDILHAQTAPKPLDLTKHTHGLVVGTVVRARIVGLEPGTDAGRHNRIALTLRPSVVNRDLTRAHLVPGFELAGEVASLEDHGLIVSFGSAISLPPGFLLLDVTASTWHVGQLLPNLHIDTATPASVRVALHPSAPSRVASRLPSPPPWTYTSLYPGLRVDAVAIRVARVLEHGGLLVELFGSAAFTAHIAPDHVWPRDTTQTPGQPLDRPARVLCVDPDAKTIALTLLPHLVAMASGDDDDALWTGGLQAGDTVRLCVERIDPRHGLLLAVDGADTVAPRAYAHISRLADAPLRRISDRADNPYRVGSVHAARVLDIDPLERLLQTTLQPAAVAAALSTTLSYDTLQVGAVVRGTVTRLEPYGALVYLGEAVKALCPLLHYSDHVSAPLRVDKQYTFRVLSIDRALRRVLVTRKRTLIDSPYPPLHSLAQAAAFGDAPFITHGWVVCIKDSVGALLSFYNDVRGWLPVAECSPSGAHVAKISDILALGQTVPVRVVAVDLIAKQLRLSMRLAPPPADVHALAKRSTREALVALGLSTDAATSFAVRILDVKPRQLNVALAACPDIQGRIRLAHLPLRVLLGSPPQPTPVRLPTLHEAEPTYRKGILLDGVRLIGLRQERLKSAYLPVSHKEMAHGRYLIECSCTPSAEAEYPVAAVLVPFVVTKVVPGVGAMIDVLDPAATHTHAPSARIHIIDIDFAPYVATGVLSEAAAAQETRVLMHPLDHFQPDGLGLASQKSKADYTACVFVHPDVYDAHADLLAVCSGPLRVNQALVGFVSAIHPTYGIYVHLLTTHGRLSGHVRVSNILKTFSRAWLQEATRLYTLGQRVRVWCLEAREDPNGGGVIACSLKGPVLSREERLARQLVKQPGPSAPDVLLFESGDFEDGLGETVASAPRTAASGHGSSRALSLLESIQMDTDIRPIVADAESEAEAESADSDRGEQGDENAVESSGQSDDERPAKPSGQGRAGKAAEEAAIRRVEAAQARPAEQPQSLADHEKAILAHPHASYHWIQYMSFLLASSSAQKAVLARAVARRALDAMPPALEAERFNIWSAWLAFEWAHALGGVLDPAAAKTDPTALDALLKDALSRADPKAIYLRLWAIVQDSWSPATDTAAAAAAKNRKVVARLKDLEKALLLKFKTSVKTWLCVYTLHAFILCDVGEAAGNAIYARACQANSGFPRRKHAKLAARVALLEYEHALVPDAPFCQPQGREKGRTLFEGLLAGAPKRYDYWVLYLQAEVKALFHLMKSGSRDTVQHDCTASVDFVRRLMERALSLPFSSKRMKGLFKLYLSFEKSLATKGTARGLVVGRSRVEHVKQLARDYVTRVASAL